MLNRKLSMAWEKWQFTAAEMARQQFLLAGALNRMLKRADVAGWEKWQQVYADLKFANGMGGGAIRRMLNRKLSMAWEKWQFTAAEMARQQFMLAWCNEQDAEACRCLVLGEVAAGVC